LTKKAEEIQDALEKHYYDQARKLLRSFLCNLGEFKGDGDDDKDCHASINPTTLTILIQDAKALLMSLPDSDHHDHDDK
jgi:hypothetical protein